MPQVQPEIARTANPLANAQKPSKGLAPPPKESAVKADQGYVPPPPSNGPKIPAPAGMPKVKEFPISSSAPPATMSFPNIKSAEAVKPTGSDAAAGAGQDIP